MNDDTNQRLYQLWTSGQELLAGQELYDAISNDARPGWAAALVEYAIAASGLDVGPVNRVAAIGHDRQRWREAHDAFRAVRKLTLEAEKTQFPLAYVGLLFVAEIAAKVIYNASGESAPFDEDSGAWVAKNFRSFTTVCAGASEVDAWRVLTSPVE